LELPFSAFVVSFVLVLVFIIAERQLCIIHKHQHIDLIDRCIGLIYVIDLNDS